jgi:predicted membrane channel-forming protein YqfA (hemolysin III family)
MAPASNPDRHFFPDLKFEIYTNICMANLILVSVGSVRLCFTCFSLVLLKSGAWYKVCVCVYVCMSE